MRKSQGAIRSTSEEVCQEESWAVVFPRTCLLSQMVFFDFLFIDENLAVFRGCRETGFSSGWREEQRLHKPAAGGLARWLLDSFE